MPTHHVAVNASLDFERVRARERHLQEIIVTTRRDLVDVPAPALRRSLRGTVDELLRLQAEMNQSLGLYSLRAEHEAVWVELRGSAAAMGTLGISAVSQVLQHIQRAVRDVLFLQQSETQTQTLRHASAALKAESELGIRAWEPLASRFALGAASPQFQLESLAPSAEHAIQELLWCAEWAEGDGTDSDLAKRWKSPALRRRLGTRVRDLAPRKSGPFTSLVFSGTLVTAPEVVLSAKAYDRLSRYVESKKRLSEKHRGCVVMIDIERLRMHVSIAGRRLHCRIPADCLPDAKRLLEREVEVEGTSYYDALGDLPYRLDVTAISDLSKPRLVRSGKTA